MALASIFRWSAVIAAVSEQESRIQKAQIEKKSFTAEIVAHLEGPSVG
jgi:hypothetical protein